MYKLRLELNEIPKKSLNQLLRTNTYARNNYCKYWYELIWVYTLNKRPPKPLKRAKVKIERHFYKKLDYDGLVGSFKPVIDALTLAGIILDDRWSVVEKIDCDQYHLPKKKGQKLVIEVTELPLDCQDSNKS